MEVLVLRKLVPKQVDAAVTFIPGRKPMRVVVVFTHKFSETQPKAGRRTDPSVTVNGKKSGFYIQILLFSFSVFTDSDVKAQSLYLV